MKDSFLVISLLLFVFMLPNITCRFPSFKEQQKFEKRLHKKTAKKARKMRARRRRARRKKARKRKGRRRKARKKKERRERKRRRLTQSPPVLLLTKHLNSPFKTSSKPSRRM